MSKKQVEKNSKEDWDQELETGVGLMAAFTLAQKNYNDWCTKVFGVRDGQPLNLIQVAQLIRQMK